MISYEVYKVMHLLGLMMLFLSLGGLTVQVMTNETTQNVWRKPLGITHGVGLLFLLVGGFGLLARLGVKHGELPGWVLVKMGIWGFFAIYLKVLTLRRAWGKPLWMVCLILGGAAAYLAGNKPF